MAFLGIEASPAMTSVDFAGNFAKGFQAGDMKRQQANDQARAWAEQQKNQQQIAMNDMQMQQMQMQLDELRRQENYRKTKEVLNLVQYANKAYQARAKTDEAGAAAEWHQTVNNLYNNQNYAQVMNTLREAGLTFTPYDEKFTNYYEASYAVGSAGDPNLENISPQEAVDKGLAIPFTTDGANYGLAPLAMLFAKMGDADGFYRIQAEAQQLSQIALEAKRAEEDRQIANANKVADTDKKYADATEARANAQVKTEEAINIASGRNIGLQIAANANPDTIKSFDMDRSGTKVAFNDPTKSAGQLAADVRQSVRANNIPNALAAAKQIPGATDNTATANVALALADNYIADFIVANTGLPQDMAMQIASTGTWPDNMKPIENMPTKEEAIARMIETEEGLSMLNQLLTASGDEKTKDLASKFSRFGNASREVAKHFSLANITNGNVDSWTGFMDNFIDNMKEYGGWEEKDRQDLKASNQAMQTFLRAIAQAKDAKAFAKELDGAAGILAGLDQQPTTLLANLKAQVKQVFDDARSQHGLLEAGIGKAYAADLGSLYAQIDAMQNIYEAMKDTKNSNAIVNLIKDTGPVKVYNGRYYVPKAKNGKATWEVVKLK